MKKKYIRPESQIFGLPKDNYLVATSIGIDSGNKAQQDIEVEARDEYIGSSAVWDSEW